jgi:energy-coupling factor transporter ATP-binding protein EcfA2
VRTGSELGKLEVDHYPARLSEALRGVGRHALILLAGAAGSGKSTLAAELGAVVAEEHGGEIWWLDRDQTDPALIRGNFDLTGSPIERLRLVQEREPTDPLWQPLPWRVALAMVPKEAAFLVVDSLETWAESLADRLELARALRAHRARVKILIAPTNANGEIAGDRALQRAGDASVTITPTTIEIGKCRWSEAPRVEPRSTKMLSDEAP